MSVLENQCVVYEDEIKPRPGRFVDDAVLDVSSSFPSWGSVSCGGPRYKLSPAAAFS